MKQLPCSSVCSSHHLCSMFSQSEMVFLLWLLLYRTSLGKRSYVFVFAFSPQPGWQMPVLFAGSQSGQKRVEEQPWQSRGAGYASAWDCLFPQTSLKQETGQLQPLFSSPVLLPLIPKLPRGPLLNPLSCSFIYITIFCSGLCSPLLAVCHRGCLNSRLGKRAGFLLAAVSGGASKRIAIATAMHTAARATNTRKTTSPVTPSLRRDAGEQMLGLTVRLSDVSHISPELGAVATAVCKQCKSSIRLGKENIYTFYIFFDFKLPEPSLKMLRIRWHFCCRSK